MEISRTKQKQRDNIIKHSRELFLKNGIANTSIKEIAEASSIYRKTVYNHFADKEEIATSILMEYLTHFQVYELIGESDETAFELLSIKLHELARYALENRDVFRFIAHYDYYFNSHSELIGNINQSLIQNTPIHKIMILGESDGSIYMHGTNATKLAFIVLRSFSKFLEDVLYRESVYKEEFGFNEEDIHTYFNILLRGLKA